jgi:phytoene/squalene synthetase
MKKNEDEMENKELFYSIHESIDYKKVSDHPNILIAARFWEEDRYEAARTYYKFMRAIDDMIDDRKALNKRFTWLEKKAYERKVRNWILAIRNDRPGRDHFKKELVTTMNDFLIPVWPIEDFAEAMIYDIDHDGFETYQDFLDYSIGATVAPSSIFVHLCGLQYDADGYSSPPFDVKEAARPCAMFSYLVHIVRDFQKDQLNHLNYFPHDLLQKHRLTATDLKMMAHGEEPIKKDFRNLVRDYLSFADKYRKETESVIKRISPLIEPRYQLSLEIIFNLYTMIYDRIDPENGTFTTEELNPTPPEIKNKVLEVIDDF